jgi:hypothetical protein
VSIGILVQCGERQDRGERYIERGKMGIRLGIAADWGQAAPGSNEKHLKHVMGCCSTRVVNDCTSSSRADGMLVLGRKEGGKEGRIKEGRMEGRNEG